MAGFWQGALLGVAIGVGGTYAALEKPWSKGTGVVDVVEPDAGEELAEAEPKKRRKKRRRRRGKGEDEVSYELVGDDIPDLTAADRKMVWKGPAVSLPAKEVDFASGGGGRALNQGEIDQGISGNRRAVVQCIADARGNAQLRAEITLKFLVDEGGRATKIRMNAPAYLFAHGLEACAQRAVRSMRFPATGAPTVVTLPLSLS